MKISVKQIQVIHVAKSKLGLSDDDYRDILRNAAGVASSTDLGEAGFEAVMFRFQQLGFTSTWNQANYGYRPKMATPRQTAMIRKLWGQFTNGQGTEASLGHWLESKFKVSALRFLPSEKASKVIGALKAMAANGAGGRKHG